MTQNYSGLNEALQLVKSNNRVFIQGGAATPLLLINTLLDRAADLDNMELMSISTYGDINWRRPEVLKSFYLNSMFVSSNVRDWVNSDRGDYIPVFLSEIPQLFNKNILPLDVALIQVSPPNKDGYCSLGTSIDATLSAVKNAKTVIAQVNPRMPCVLGDGIIHTSEIKAAVWHESELPEVNYSAKRTSITLQIGKNVAGLIEDGSTLQMGIGAIPDAVLDYLKNHKNLGIHSEMFSDGVIDLIRNGVVTNANKKILPGKTVATFIIGTRKVYDFVNNNNDVWCKEVSFVNDTSIIRQNPKVIAINSAIEIDLTGQICSDSIGKIQYSGIGGQMDFMRGAALSEGGKPIIALPSTTNSGISRIVPYLREGAGVVTTRGHVHYVVTEYGSVTLYGKNMEQRARLLISIAHPQHREQLEKAFNERFEQRLKI